jgi:hypothetical protein
MLKGLYVELELEKQALKINVCGIVYAKCCRGVGTVPSPLVGILDIRGA